MGNQEIIEYLIDDSFDFNTLYGQCNNHLIEADRKRDQVLILLASITGLYIGNINTLKAMPGFKVLAFSMVVMGIIFAFLVLEYRKWHIKYSLACLVIQRLMFIKNDIINQKIITKILREIVKTTTFKYLITKTETWVFNLYVAINFLNIYILEASFKISDYIIYSSLIIYSIIFNYIYYKSIKKLCNKEKIKSSSIWIINLFGSHEDVND